MFLRKTIDIAEHERAFLYKRDRFVRVLSPGRHRVSRLFGSTRVERFDITRVVFRHQRAEFLLNQYAELGAYLVRHKLTDTQFGLLYRENKLVDVLEPGSTVIYWKGVEQVRVETYDISQLVFEHPRGKFLMSNYADMLKEYLDVCELGEREVGLFYRDKQLVDVLAPGTYLLTWKGIEKAEVKVVNIDKSYVIDERLLAVLGRGLKMGKSREVVNAIAYGEVPDQHLGLVQVDGKMQKVLQPGPYGFWKYNRGINVKLMDMRLQNVEVSGQEILTKDRVSLRINLSASFRILDAEIVTLKLKDYASFVYLELQLRLREAVGTKQLDELLEDKDALNTVIANAAKQRFAEYGIELHDVGVKDIILPGDMKVILNKVVEAQKEAEANLVKRREETQAMRSLHNTAKMMENNPVLMRLKELEALERVTERIDKITVYGGLEGVLKDLVKLAPVN